MNTVTRLWLFSFWGRGINIFIWLKDSCTLLDRNIELFLVLCKSSFCKKGWYKMTWSWRGRLCQLLSVKSLSFIPPFCTSFVILAWNFAKYISTWLDGTNIRIYQWGGGWGGIGVQQCWRRKKELASPVCKLWTPSVRFRCKSPSSVSSPQQK